MQGDVIDAIETLSGLLVATHVHDNHGRRDEHLAPFEGTIDWPGAADRRCRRSATTAR